ncbi:MFS transporter [Argonema galeatum]|uniref:MFS transporter n=1 Tax=Argonema galeatum TaxID=2942762 RepID=UPI0020135E31|nr:MFS transporter [Argonema galeatum]MCL1467449.1 MFS transporter [Argonema galeatum A003/A1]
MSVFILIWFGQLVSLIGSGLTSFALGIWVYQKTGSVTEFALISLFTFLPSILLLPIAGAFVDRWNRRSALLSVLISCLVLSKPLFYQSITKV